MKNLSRLFLTPTLCAERTKSDSIGVFTLNGVSPIQLVAVIAFSGGVYAARFLPGTSARFTRTTEHDRETERPLPT